MRVGTGTLRGWFVFQLPKVTLMLHRELDGEWCTSRSQEGDQGYRGPSGCTCRGRGWVGACGTGLRRQGHCVRNWGCTFVPDVKSMHRESLMLVKNLN